METEEALEDAYQSYLERRGARDAAARAAAAKRARLGDGGELAGEDGDGDAPDPAVRALLAQAAGLAGARAD